VLVSCSFFLFSSCERFGVHPSDLVRMCFHRSLVLCSSEGLACIGYPTAYVKGLTCSPYASHKLLERLYLCLCLCISVFVSVYMCINCVSAVYLCLSVSLSLCIFVDVSWYVMYVSHCISVSPCLRHCSYTGSLAVYVSVHLRRQCLLIATLLSIVYRNSTFSCFLASSSFSLGSTAAAAEAAAATAVLVESADNLRLALSAAVSVSVSASASVLVSVPVPGPVPAPVSASASVFTWKCKGVRDLASHE